jgi:hypothetical protein
MKVDAEGGRQTLNKHNSLIKFADETVNRNVFINQEANKTMTYRKAVNPSRLIKWILPEPFAPCAGLLNFRLSPRAQSRS